MEEENLNEVYQHKNDGELFKDKPSEPLKTNAPYKKSKKKEDKKEEVVEEVKSIIENKSVPKIKILSERERFNGLVLDGRPFFLKYHGNIIFDSERNKINELDFQEDGYFLFGKKMPYDGLSFKFKKK